MTSHLMIDSHGPRGRCATLPSEPVDLPARDGRRAAGSCGDGVHILIVGPMVGGCASAIPVVVEAAPRVSPGCVCNATSLRVRNDTPHGDRRSAARLEIWSLRRPERALEDTDRAADLEREPPRPQLAAAVG